MSNYKNIKYFLFLFFIALPLLGQNWQSFSVDVKLKIVKTIGIKTVHENKMDRVKKEAKNDNDFRNISHRELLVQYNNRNKSAQNYSVNKFPFEQDELSLPEIKIFNNDKKLLGILSDKNKNLISHISTDEALVFAYPNSESKPLTSKDLSITIVY